MKTYNYLSNEMPRELIELYNDMQGDLLKIIVRNLKNNTRPEKVYQQIRDKVDEYKPKAEQILLIIYEDSEKKTVKDNQRVAESETEALTKGEANAIIAPIVANAMLLLGALNNKIVNNAVNKYSEGFSYSNAKTTKLTSGIDRLKQVYKNLANKGISIYESFGGGKSRNYSIENILRRDVMSMVNKANAEVDMDNFKKSSAKFIEVSSHPTARTGWRNAPFEDHSSWQGKVYYSRNGDIVEGYDEFESTCGYSELLGIGGINCYHQFQMSYDSDNTATKYSQEEVEKNYLLSQQQRAYERAIRQLKQARAVYEEAGDTQLAQSIGRNISTATSQLKSFCEKNDLKYYNWRTKI